MFIYMGPDSNERKVKWNVREPCGWCGKRFTRPSGSKRKKCTRCEAIEAREKKRNEGKKD